MSDRWKTILAQVEKDGIAPLSPLQLSPFESELLGNAFYVDDAQCMMHYMSVARFKMLIGNGGLYFRRLDLFDDDPAEGTFPAANDEKPSQLTKDFAAQLGMDPKSFSTRRDFIQGTLRELTFIHCWFGWDNEDKTMWEKYGDQGRGVCIRTAARKLRGALRRPPDFGCNLCGVTYTDEEDPIPELISFMAACRKRSKFKNEREIRLIAQAGDKTWNEFLQSELGFPEFILVPVDFELLFERISVGPNASTEDMQEIEALADKAAGCRVTLRSMTEPF